MTKRSMEDPGYPGRTEWSKENLGYSSKTERSREYPGYPGRMRGVRRIQ